MGKLPAGVGTITVKAVSFPLKAGRVNIPVDVKVSALIPASLASTSTHIEAVDQNGESVICLDVNTKKAAELEAEKAAELEAEAATLGVTWGDCGAKHATVDDLSPTSIKTGGSGTTLTGSGVSDEDVTSAVFTATVKAKGVKVASCSGDATSDIVCKLPAGVGTITVKAVSFPLKAGRVNIPVEVKVSALIPGALATTDTHIEAVDQNGESVICLDVATKKAASFEEIAEEIDYSEPDVVELLPSNA